MKNLGHVENKNNITIKSTRWKNLLGFLVAIICLAATVFLSLMIGSKAIPFETVWNALFAMDGSYEHVIIHNTRIPRTIIALIVGPAFGLAGAIIQVLTRNPLADPGILGVNAGATFAVAIGVGVFSVSTINGYIWFALVGALFASAAVYLISGGGKKSPTPEQVVLAGVAFGAVLSGVTNALTLMNSKAFSSMLNWQVGTLAKKSMDDISFIVPFIVLGILIAFVIAPALNTMSFGEERASSLGVNVGVIRIAALIAITLLAGGATAIVGPIGFIGLMVPHCVRWFVGPNQFWIFLYTLVVSPIILLLSDIIGRVVMLPGEVPVGIITGFIGAPILLLLVRRRKASGL